MKTQIAKEVIDQIIKAVPVEGHSNIIIVGRSLQALPVRLKDIDCVLIPRIQAVDSGKAIAQKLASE